VRVVLDTNVLISAFIFPGGAPEAVYRLAIEGRVRLVVSRPLLAELGRVLAEKFGWAPGRAEDAVAQVLRIGDLVRPKERVRVVVADPSDDHVLDAAAAGGVDAIVSGDRHLLRLRAWRGIKVLDPSRFLAESGL
jgi:putative PIN family toxin of toxin-antitoxin system